MGVLDTVMNETGSELGISSTSSRSVLSGLLSFINQEDGGFGGFLDRFRRAGAGNAVTSWLSGEAKPVSADTVENALGHQAIERIGTKAGLSFSTAAAAIASMLPKLTPRLAPGGAIPRGLSNDIRSYITAPGAAVASGVSTAAAAIPAAVAKPAAGIGRFLWPLLLLLGGLLLVFWMINRGSNANRAVFNVDDQVRKASERASAALTALRPGFSARDLAGALNMQVINFAPGSAEIPMSSYDSLNKSAAAFRNAPAGTVVEIAGHTDNTGDAASNLQLSQQRADAVRNYLVQQGVSPAMLTTTGYGDTKPLGSNDTEAGRFHNRRIEFTAK